MNSEDGHRAIAADDRYSENEGAGPKSGQLCIYICNQGSFSALRREEGTGPPGSEGFDGGAN